MPEILRAPLRMNFAGIDLVSPIDRMPEGSFPYAFNTRVLVEGRVDGRPGYEQFMLLRGGDFPNSVRRLNDPDGSQGADHTYVGGAGTKLYAGGEGAYIPIDTGYSGKPLSLIPFRPEASPESWMYVYDAAKQVKVRTDGTLRAIGVAPPPDPPSATYGPPAMALISDVYATTGWVLAGGSTTIASVDRTLGPEVTGDVVYDSGTTGWCAIDVGTADTTWAGERMRLRLNPGGGNDEIVLVREVHPAIASTTIAAIDYDSGSTGDCTIVLTGNPGGLARNSLITITGEPVKVQSVQFSPDQTTYSIRATTNGSYAAGAVVLGRVSLYCYTVNHHISGEAIYSQYNFMSGASGDNFAALLVNEDASNAGGRPISITDDWMHVSLFFQTLENITSVTLYIDIDPSTTTVGAGGNAFTRNYWEWVIPASQLIPAGFTGSGTWVEVIVPISSGTRIGNSALDFSTVKAIQIKATNTGVSSYGLNSWYFFGTYGPSVLANSPAGLLYATVFRDSSTGAESVPSPPTQYELFPLREQVLVTTQTTSQSGVDSADVYRQGGALTALTFIGSAAPGGVFADNLSDTSAASNPQADFTKLQPWPTIALTRSGEVNVIGSSVRWVSGDKFDLTLVSGTVISINGVSYQVLGQPVSNELLRITASGSVQSGVGYRITSPLLAAQPLPFAFGPLEGPFAPVVFALGDPVNGGTLYYSNFNDADSASDANNIELAPPSSDLVSGAVWNGIAFAGNRDDVFMIRYSYLASIGASGNVSYQWQRVPSPSGFWARRAVCATPVGVAFLGRDGIYIATEQGAANISDGKLYPIFPHEGQAASAVNSGSNIILPVDMAKLDDLRLVYCDEELRFSYRDTGNNSVTLVYQIYKKRWLLWNFADKILTHYLVEDSAEGPNTPQILLLAAESENIFLSGGNTDNGQAINSILLTPSLDTGDERTQKLWVDSMTQADGSGTIELAAAFDNAQSFSPIVPIICSGSIQQTLQNLASLSDLSLHRNIGAKFAWTGGPDGPRIYAWEPSGFAQPYLSKFFVTQYLNLSFPGWKHARRMYPALISVFDVLLTIRTQDGRVFGPYTIPSTAGQYRILPQMLDHGLKDLAFVFQLDGQGFNFALFPADFTIEFKQWSEASYIDLAVFKT